MVRPKTALDRMFSIHHISHYWEINLGNEEGTVITMRSLKVTNALLIFCTCNGRIFESLQHSLGSYHIVQDASACDI